MRGDSRMWQCTVSFSECCYTDVVPLWKTIELHMHLWFVHCFSVGCTSIKITTNMTSLLVQCLRIHLAMQRTLVLDWEDPWSGNIPHVLKQQSPCATTTEVMLWSWRAATTEPECPKVCVLQQEKPPQGEAHAPQLESSPLLLQLEKACLQQWWPSTV